MCILKEAVSFVWNRLYISLTNPTLAANSLIDLLKAQLRDGTHYCSRDADLFMIPLLQEYREKYPFIGTVILKIRCNGLVDHLQQVFRVNVYPERGCIVCLEQAVYKPDDNRSHLYP